MVKKAAAIFISGKGSNLKALLLNSKTYNFPIEIKLVVSSNKNAKGLVYAKKWSVPYIIFNNNNILNEIKLLNELKKRKIKMLCLAGYMKILSKNFIKIFNNNIINIHPSLLPKFKGIKTFERILKNKEKKTGCSVHYVNDKLDSGKIILKKSFFIENSDNISSLKKKTQFLEYRAFSQAIIKLYSQN